MALNKKRYNDGEKNYTSAVWYTWRGMLERKVTPFSIDVEDGRAIEVSTVIDNLNGSRYVVTTINSAKIVRGKLRVTGKSHKINEGKVRKSQAEREV